MLELQRRLSLCNREQLVEDIVQLIDDEVGRKRGVRGVALRTGYKFVQSLKEGRMIAYASRALLDSFTKVLAPFYDDFLTSSDAHFETYLCRDRGEVAEALLGVTDHIAGNDSEASFPIRRTYNALRGHARHHVEEAVPALGRLIDQYAPKLSGNV